MKVRWTRLRSRCRKRGILCTVSFEHLWDQWSSQNGKCFYSDISIIIDFGNGVSPDSLSIDKVEPHLGYIDGNVVLAAHRINTIKHDMTLEEMKAWTPDWYQRVAMWRRRGLVCCQVAEGDF